MPEATEGLPEITDEQKNDYYSKCNQLALENQSFLDWWQKRGLSTELITRFNIGIDPHANPGNYPWGVGDILWYETRVIFPVSTSFYITWAPHPNKEKYRIMNPKHGKVDIWNKQELWEGHSFVVVVESVWDALSIIQAGGFAIALNGDSDRRLREALREKRTSSKLILCLGDTWNGEGAETKLADYLPTLGVTVEIRSLRNGYETIQKRLEDMPDKLRSELANISGVAETEMRNSGQIPNAQPQDFGGHTCRSTLEAEMLAAVYSSGSIIEYEPEHYNTENGQYLIDCKVSDVIVVDLMGRADKRTIVFEGKGKKTVETTKKVCSLSSDACTYIWGDHVATGNIDDIVNKFETCYCTDRGHHLPIPSFSFVGINGLKEMAFAYISERGMLTLASPDIMYDKRKLGGNVINEWMTKEMYGVLQKADWARYDPDREPEKLAKAVQDKIINHKRNSMQLYGS